MTQLQDLPQDVLQRIFNYVPNDLLVELIDIPAISSLVANALYSTVLVGKRSKITSKIELQGTNKLPIVQHISHIVKLQKKYPNLKPKKWIFANKFDALEQGNEFPQILENSQVEILLQEKIGLFCMKYTQSSIQVTSVTGFQVRRLRDIIDSRLLNCMESVYRGGHNTWPKLSSFPNLTSLRVSAEVSPTQLYRLPRHLKKLFIGLEIKKRDYRKEKNHPDMITKFDFPNGLTELSMEFSPECAYDCCFHVDISHLTMLRKLSIRPESNFGSEQVGLQWILPKSIRWLDYVSYHTISGFLKTSCPQLISLIADQADGDLIDHHIKKLPDTLQELKTSCEGVVTLPRHSRDDNGNKRHKPDLTDKYPSGLKKLSIYDPLGKFSKRSRIIQIPPTITSLKLCEISNIDFDSLQDLENLVDLVMASSPGRIEVFDYKLPPSLKSLTIRNSKIKKFIIDAPNLETLIIGGDLEGIVVDESKLVIPSSLKKLTLEDNKIEELAIALPESLEWLDLSLNKLKNLKNIPSGLTHLDLSNNKFGSTDEIITFPVNLKLLNLNSNPIHDDWISKLNLSNLMELKDLFLVEIKLSTLNIEYLPVSLVALDIHGGTISSIVEDFKNFVNLQELNISGNRLSEELKLSISSNPQFFSENLTYCVI